MTTFKVGDVVQFNENAEWCGSLGIITEVKDCHENGIRYQVGVPIPLKGTAYIFVMDKEKALEYIGKSIFMASTIDNIDDNPVCCLCGKHCEDKYGNNPEPLSKEGRCCNKCNAEKVVPARLTAWAK